MPVPTEAMAREAQRGLDWRREYGRGGTEVGVARARDIANRRNLSMETVRRIKAYYDRHQSDRDAEGFFSGEDGFPSAGRIAWQLWGSSSADESYEWAKRILEQEDDERAETRPYPGEHAARIMNPDVFDEFSRVNDQGGDGIDFIFGVRSDGSTDVQSIRFDADLYTEQQALDWLSEHDFEVLKFEPALPEAEEMTDRAEPDELQVDDFVTWDSSGGEVYGRILRIERDGVINVPGTEFEITGTAEDPAALIMVYRETDEGWGPSGTRVGHKFSTLTKVQERYGKDKDKRHIKKIEETSDEIIITFGKSEQYVEPSDEIMSDREFRPARKVEVREGHDGSIKVAGYAAVFNEETTIGGQFREMIAPGAFTNAIGRDDVVFLINHEGLPLARTRSGTLTLREDDRGLYMEAMLDMSDPDVRSIVPKMRRGDLDKMSFAFIPVRQSWSEDAMPLRTVEEAQLYDVSIVTTPAYNQTEIGLRHKPAKKESLVMRRLRMKARLLGK